MKKLGWQADGAGGAMLLADCVRCRSTCAIDEMADACVCATCCRLVVGETTDPKVCVVDAKAGPLVLCLRCFWRDPRRGGWTCWAPELTGPSARRMIAESA
jgi:hypothetical protein